MAGTPSAVPLSTPKFMPLPRHCSPFVAITTLQGVAETESDLEGMFGAINVGGGLTKLLGLPPIAAGVIKDVMTIGALALGFMLGRQQSSHTATALLACRKIRSGEEPANHETLCRKANLRPPSCHSES
jgi:hypothetical protein